LGIQLTPSSSKSRDSGRGELRKKEKTSASGNVSTTRKKRGKKKCTKVREVTAKTPGKVSLKKKPTTYDYERRSSRVPRKECRGGKFTAKGGVGT